MADENTTETTGEELTGDLDNEGSDESSDEGSTSEASGDTTETPAAKKARVGGRVRAFAQVEAAVNAAIITASAKNQNDMVRYSGITLALTELAASITALHAPKVKKARTNLTTVVRPWYVGVRAAGQEGAGSREAFHTAPPAGIRYAEVVGPFMSRLTALGRIDDGFKDSDPRLTLNQ